jgi:phage N-6-adenine-methyltransferase
MPALALVRSDVDQLKQLAATANRAHRDGVRAVIVAGQALLEAKKLVPHRSWNRWIKEHCEFSDRTAQLYMRAARHPEVAGQTLNQIIGALRKPGRYSYCSGDEEWYTPAAIVEAARQVMGRIDLDPASCVDANAVVQARKFYSIQDDGLRQQWRGRMFINPPYSATKISKFIEKLVGHVKDRSVSEAIILINAETEVRWFRTLSGVAAAVCFPTGRIKFYKPGPAKPTGTCPLGSAVVYIGRRPKAFERSFRRFGHVWFS